MSLTMYVGMLLDIEEDEMEELNEEFDAINELLTSAGLPKHEEPKATDDDYWNFIIGYGSLEQYVYFVSSLKKSGKIKLEDSVLNHLLKHSTSEGYFAPIDFSDLLENDEVQVGSCYRLREISEEVARFLQIPKPLKSIPVDYSAEGVELSEELNGWKDEGIWREHISETLLCIILYQGASVSIKNKMLLGFG